MVAEYLVKPWYPSIVLSGYALVGGAGLAAGVTHAFSTVIIVCEMTGQLEYLFPVLVSVVTAVIVSSMVNVSIFERIVLDKRLPYLPQLRADKYRVTASEIMDPKVFMLPRQCYMHEVEDLLQLTSDRYLPVVNNVEERVLLAMVSRTDLEESLVKYQRDDHLRGSQGLFSDQASDGEQVNM